MPYDTCKLMQFFMNYFFTKISFRLVNSKIIFSFIEEILEVYKKFQNFEIKDHEYCLNPFINNPKMVPIYIGFGNLKKI